MNTIQKIREYFIKQLDIAGLSKNEQDKTIEEFSDLVMKNVMMGILEKLPEERREEFAQLLEKQDHIGMGKLIKENIPDVEQVVKDEIKQQVEDFNSFRKETAS